MSTPKHRWGSQTVNFPPQKLGNTTFHCLESHDIFTMDLQLSPVWLVFHGLHSHRKWFWVRVTVFSTSNYEVHGMHLDNASKWRIRFIPPWRKHWRKITRAQVDLKLLESINDMSRPHEIASEADISHLLQGWQLPQCMTKLRAWHHFASVHLQCFSHVLNRLLTSV